MSNTDTSGILLIGDSGAAVFGAAPTGRPAVQVCGNIHDAIETVRKTVSPQSPW